MLEIVGQALKENSVNYIICSNKSKDFCSVGGIELFKSDPDIKILLLPLALGAEGLDLIAANNIFLLEPILNSFQESQAINRIVRIGQLKDTFVYKYIISDTVEEKIVEFQERLLKTVSSCHSPIKHRKKNSFPSGNDSFFLTIEDIKFLFTP
jgi:E3 ubiquitin-protein ligase SHPRH